MNAERKTSIALVASDSKVHPINKSTTYDVPNQLRKLADAIEHGDFGRVTDAALVVRGFSDSSLQLHVRHFGTGSQGDLMLMVERFRQRVAR
jgi:hypothetical protein